MHGLGSFGGSQTCDGGKWNWESEGRGGFRGLPSHPSAYAPHGSGRPQPPSLAPKSLPCSAGLRVTVITHPPPRALQNPWSTRDLILASRSLWVGHRGGKWEGKGGGDKASEVAVSPVALT